jgi:hypothetical protein
VTLIPLADRGWCLAARADTLYTTVADAAAAGARFKAVTGTAVERGLREAAVSLDSVASEIAEAPLSELLAGDVDVVPIDSRIADVVLEEFPELRMFPATCREEPLWPDRFGLLVVTDDPAWVQFVAALGAKLQSEGWFEGRIEQFLGGSAIRAVVRNLGDR